MNQRILQDKIIRNKTQPPKKIKRYDSRSRLLKDASSKPAFNDLIASKTELPRGAEPLALLNYESELSIKRESLLEFSKLHNLPYFADIIASPEPRHYRSTSKRRVFITSKGVVFKFEDDRSANGLSILEPISHANIYERLQYAMQGKTFRKYIDSLTRVIVRGSPGELCIIFNVSRRSAAFVGMLAKCANELSQEMPQITSALLFLDESRSNYYLDSEAKSTKGAWKKIFGSGLYHIKVGEMTFRISAKIFSQINQSLLPSLTTEVLRLSNPEGRPVIDLFCGYGLFALTLASESSRVTGIENDIDAIYSAQLNAKRMEISNTRFFRRYISDETFADLLKYNREREIFILDPPRQGVDNTIIAAIAQREPKRAAHIFCNIEEIPRSVSAWRSNGYEVSKLVPLDLFPGAPVLETIALLERKN